ncbi:hypothetical protein OOT33_06350 [Sphingobium sp. DEHP117]|uniref:hypothetical protein n=1 Tax=Sphingobium sp. DEHP117 TaxID=2993436 RepID=UPI0027D6FF90|nr:hypothetical protein [Sphingobium sp. DEHP117]MDQ4420058.1 hypothetical protein [Sphingobium sp. DEHP117]
MKIAQTGVGFVENLFAVRALHGWLLPVQVAVEGTATYRILGRVSPEAQWRELRAADTVSCLEAVNWVPYVRLEVLSGDGSATLWLGEG